MDGKVATFQWDEQEYGGNSAEETQGGENENNKGGTENQELGTSNDDCRMKEAGASNDGTTVKVENNLGHLIRTRGTALAKVKLGYATRNKSNTSEAEIRLVHVYVGLAEEDSKKRITSIKTDSVLFFLGQKNIENHFQIHIT